MIRRRTLAFGFGVTLLVALGCNIGGRAADGGAPVESLAQLSTELGLQLPPSTRIVGVRRISGGMDSAIKVKVELPAAELPGVLAQTQIDAESFEPGAGGLLGPDNDFWDPHRAIVLRTGQAKRPNGRVLNVGIDDGRPGLAVLFIVVHET